MGWRFTGPVKLRDCDFFSRTMAVFEPKTGSGEKDWGRKGLRSLFCGAKWTAMPFLGRWAFFGRKRAFCLIGLPALVGSRVRQLGSVAFRRLGSSRCGSLTFAQWLGVSGEWLEMRNKANWPGLGAAPGSTKSETRSSKQTRNR